MEKIVSFFRNLSSSNTIFFALVSSCSDALIYNKFRTKNEGSFHYLHANHFIKLVRDTPLNLLVIWPLGIYLLTFSVPLQ